MKEGQEDACLSVPPPTFQRQAALPRFPQEPVEAAQKLSVGNNILALSQPGKDLLLMQGTSLQMTPLASQAVLRPTFCKGFVQ